jgi:hypothetical protein
MIAGSIAQKRRIVEMDICFFDAITRTCAQGVMYQEYDA